MGRASYMLTVTRLIGVVFLANAVPLPAAADRAFETFVLEVQNEARRKGIDEQYVQALTGLRPNPEVVRLSHWQPEYVKPMWAYIDHLVTPERLRLGRKELKKQAVFLAELEKKYGVPRTIVMAIWGVETNYGSNKGSFPILQALATLGYRGKRANFGREQLLAALAILQAGDVTPDGLVGSWAGAMGYTQFIPTTYRAYAVDGTGDGVRNIWTEPKDALASTANYLKISGWQRGIPWGIEVSVPDNFDFSLASFGRFERAGFWRQHGVNGRVGPLGNGYGFMSLFAPAGYRGPMFLVTRNFSALMRYNSAPAYALAVGHLADRFYADYSFVANWPQNDRPFRPHEISLLQEHLRVAGYMAGDIDGVFGRITRAAVRRYQKASGLVVDGYATPGLINHLRKRLR